MNQRYILITLRELQLVVDDAQHGYRQCAEHARSDVLRTLFAARARRYAAAGSQLCALITEVGGDPGVRGRLADSGRRGWSRLPEIGTLNSDAALMDECSLGVDRALEVYRNALDDHLPDFVQVVVLRQFEEMMGDHDQIRFVQGDSLQGGLMATGSGGEARQ